MPSIVSARGTARDKRRRATLRDVAAATGVSEAAVSLSLRGLPGVSDETRRRVTEAAQKLDYSPNLSASTLAAKRSGIIGVIVGDLHNPFFADLSDAVSAVAETHGLRVLLGTGYYDQRRELEALETFRDLQVDGTILVGAQIGAEQVAAIDALTPVVAVGCLSQASTLDRVVVDDRLGARIATEHLLSLGHTEIAHIHGGAIAGGDDRLAGFTDAMDAAGLQPGPVVGGGFTSETGAKGAVELLDQLPTAIVACSDLVAWGAIAELSRNGVAVPDQVSMIGYDNSTTAAPVGDFLTTIDGDRTELGIRAVELLMQRLDGRLEPRLEVIKPELVVRSSTGGPRDAPKES